MRRSHGITLESLSARVFRRCAWLCRFLRVYRTHIWFPFPMTRPKRQRPSWLPTWIPFKDGRFLGLARQTVLAWTSIILALIFYSMTISFALGSSFLSQSPAVYTSPSRNILILRIFSEAAGLFLGATIHSAFEAVQWVLISRAEGIRLPHFLALQPSTGPLGLLVLALGRGLPPSEWPLKPRFVSLLRLAAGILVPLSGVLIMSNVNTDVTYTPHQHTTTSMAFGIEQFNASVAAQLGVLEDTLFNMDYVAFLSNPVHAIDITPSFKQHEGCSRGMGLKPSSSCMHKVLIAQELQNVVANLSLSRTSEARVILTSAQRIFSLEFHDNINLPKDSLTCNDFHSGPAWYTLCMGSIEDGTIYASINFCPANLVILQQCAEDKTWRSANGFSTSLRASYVNATVAYDRLSGRILWHEVQSSSQLAGIEPLDLFDALSVILHTGADGLSPPNPEQNKNDTGASLSNPILGSPTYFFGRLICGQMHRISRLSLSTNIEAHWKGTNALQNLLAITLFYCQNGILSQTILPFVINSSQPANFTSRAAFKEQAKTTLVSFADIRYTLEVGRGTLFAYIVISGFTLLICIITLMLGSCVELARLDSEPTLWPSLDFYTQCRVEEDSGKVVPANKRVELAWIHDGRQLFREIEGLRVRRRKRQLRPLELEASKPAACTQCHTS